MPHITRELLRKRAEHNEGIISSLEEISLHQEELESINEVLGKTCRKLKILYLQNNIIPKMEHLSHMKDLEYLNLALNNITVVEGLQNCEFLRKLDLTVNFIDVERLRESLEHLQSRLNLQELYLMGNPAQAHWPDHFNAYVIAKLPQLKSLDGTEITRSMRIQAQQQLPRLEDELQCLVDAKQPRVTLLSEEGDVKVEDVDDDDPNALTENTPEVRVKIYKELAAQKKEKEDRGAVNAPKQRDYEKEQAEAISSVRQKEQEVEEKEIKQKNEGGWEFFWDEETKPGSIQLEVRLQKHLDSSLIDVDIHPTYVSIVIKSKVLRLRLPAEINVGESKCQRAKTNGALLVIMPKTDFKANAVTIRGDIKHRQQQQREAQAKVRDANRVKIKAPKALSLQEMMMQEALQSSATSVDASGLDMLRIVPQPISKEAEQVPIPAPPRIGVSIEELD